MTRTVKHIIAAMFVFIMVSKGLFSVVAAVYQHKCIDVIAQSGPAESENSEQESEQKSGEKEFVPEEFADIALPVIIPVPRVSHGHYMSADITHLTELAVFTPPPEQA
ncbi:hypothetical protein DC498_00920 [Terrimonas sp.]|uniref:hypothetical protein n=1 Tax=Terrimonas sp. TaxID=1914338 RepID=UPI000D50FEAE|nr:hypothetical protein [Terrimonas sp.]PVD53989.1 hypothetical protein DC498_00920 [Terrimonas sp.]